MPEDHLGLASKFASIADANVAIAVAVQIADVAANNYIATGAPIFIVLPVVAFFYCLGALYDDRRDRSILDWVVQSTTALKGSLGAADQARLADYLDDVREIERRIQKIEAQNSTGEPRALPGAPIGVLLVFFPCSLVGEYWPLVKP